MGTVFTWVVTKQASLQAVVVAAAALAVGCGGRIDIEASSFGGTAEAPSGRAASPVYFSVTNHVVLPGGASAAGIDVVAGANMTFEIVTEDAAPLHVDLYRERRDGTMQMLEPVHVASGFHLTTLEASSDGRIVLWFPNAPAGQRVMVHMDCNNGDGRCTRGGQPGEACAPGFECDRGLSCGLSPGECRGATWRGRCEITGAEPSADEGACVGGESRK